MINFDGSVVDGLQSGPKFNTQNPHDNSQPTVTPGLLQALNAHGTQIHMQAEHPYT